MTMTLQGSRFIEVFDNTYFVVFRDTVVPNPSRNRNGKFAEYCGSLLNKLFYLKREFSFDTIIVEQQMCASQRGMNMSALNNCCLQTTVETFAKKLKFDLETVSPQYWHAHFNLTGLRTSVQLYNRMGLLNGVVNRDVLKSEHKYDCCLIAISILAN
eukprot:NODE_780_length_3936_cov_0.468335.p2 type:complete len:157 gc:universal NODE_780_length_3936_cov_0.468335:3669-3199(-)